MEAKWALESNRSKEANDILTRMEINGMMSVISSLKSVRELNEQSEQVRASKFLTVNHETCTRRD